jgi:hypothetical protein
MQVLWIKFCFPSRTDSTKVFTNVAASFVKASFVSSKEGFQQKFPQKLLQVLLEQILFPIRVGLSSQKNESIALLALLLTATPHGISNHIFSNRAELQDSRNEVHVAEHAYK